jgi:hypothetical protein
MAGNHSTSAQQLQELRKLLARLPSSLPEPSAATTRYPFINFEPDLEFLERTESELGAVNESLKSIFGWKSRTTGDKTLPILERGKNICAVADVLEHYLKLYPGDAILLKWVADLSEAARKVGQAANKVRTS